jgi:predicted DNA-binding transcriptional regulator YafY
MHRVQLEFDASAAQLIRERAWHPGERLAFAIELSSLEENIPWILSWGEHVHVVHPVALKRRPRTTVEMMTKNLCE